MRVLPKGGNGQVVRVPSFFYHEERLDAELICTTLSYSNLDSKCLKQMHYAIFFWTTNLSGLVSDVEIQRLFHHLQAVRFDILGYAWYIEYSYQAKRHKVQVVQSSCYFL